MERRRARQRFDTRARGADVAALPTVVPSFAGEAIIGPKGDGTAAEQFHLRRKAKDGPTQRAMADIKGELKIGGNFLSGWEQNETGGSSK